MDKEQAYKVFRINDKISEKDKLKQIYDGEIFLRSLGLYSENEYKSWFEQLEQMEPDKKEKSINKKLALLQYNMFTKVQMRTGLTQEDCEEALEAILLGSAKTFWETNINADNIIAKEDRKGRYNFVNHYGKLCCYVIGEDEYFKDVFDIIGVTKVDENEEKVMNEILFGRLEKEDIERIVDKDRAIEMTLSDEVIEKAKENNRFIPEENKDLEQKKKLAFVSEQMEKSIGRVIVGKKELEPVEMSMLIEQLEKVQRTTARNEYSRRKSARQDIKKPENPNEERTL